MRFGTVVAVHNDDIVNRNTYAPRSDVGIFCGYKAEMPNSIMVYLPETRKVIDRRSYRIIPTPPACWGLKEKSSYSPANLEAVKHISEMRENLARCSNPGPTTTISTTNAEENSDLSVNTTANIQGLKDCVQLEGLPHENAVQNGTNIVEEDADRDSGTEKVNADHISDVNGQVNNEVIAPPAPMPIVHKTADHRGEDTTDNKTTVVNRYGRKAKSWANLKEMVHCVIDYKGVINMESILEYCFKFSLNEGLRDPDLCDATVQATEAELNNMSAKNVFDFIKYEDIPKHERKNIIYSMLFLTKKYNSGGEFVKMKARLVAGGDKENVELFDRVAAPTINKVTLFVLFQIAASYDCYLDSVDFPAAYLNSAVPQGKNIFIRLPNDITKFIIENGKVSNEMLSDGKLYIKLKKYLYGLKESGYEWYKLLSSTLMDMGFVRYIGDQGLFIMRKEPVFIILGLHVDDLLIVSNSKNLRARFISDLESIFGTITYNPNTTSYLGLRISRDFRD